MTLQSAWHAALSYLAACGVQVRTYHTDAVFYIHARMIPSDQRRVFLGNRELGIITQNPRSSRASGKPSPAISRCPALLALNTSQT